MINKNFYRKTNDKKILHKVGKQWKVVSVALLLAIGGGAVATHAANAAETDDADNASVNTLVNTLNSTSLANAPRTTYHASANSTNSSAASSSATIKYYPGSNGSAASYFDKVDQDNAKVNQYRPTVNAYVQSLNAEYNPQVRSFANDSNSARNAASNDSKLANAYSAVANKNTTMSTINSLAAADHMDPTLYQGMVEDNEQAYSGAVSSASNDVKADNDVASLVNSLEGINLASANMSASASDIVANSNYVGAVANSNSVEAMFAPYTNNSDLATAASELSYGAVELYAEGNNVNYNANVASLGKLQGVNGAALTSEFNASVASAYTSASNKFNGFIKANRIPAYASANSRGYTVYNHDLVENATADALNSVTNDYRNDANANYNAAVSAATDTRFAPVLASAANSIFASYGTQYANYTARSKEASSAMASASAEVRAAKYAQDFASANSDIVSNLSNLASQYGGNASLANHFVTEGVGAFEYDLGLNNEMNANTIKGYDRIDNSEYYLNAVNGTLPTTNTQNYKVTNNVSTYRVLSDLYNIADTSNKDEFAKDLSTYNITSLVNNNTNLLNDAAGNDNSSNKKQVAISNVTNIVNSVNPNINSHQRNSGLTHVPAKTIYKYAPDKKEFNDQNYAYDNSLGDYYEFGAAALLSAGIDVKSLEAESGAIDNVASTVANAENSLNIAKVTSASEQLDDALSVANSSANSALSSADSASAQYSTANDEDVTLANYFATSYASDANKESDVASNASSGLDSFFQSMADDSTFNDADNAYNAAETAATNDYKLGVANAQSIYNSNAHFLDVTKGARLHSTPHYGSKKFNDKVVGSVKVGDRLTVHGVNVSRNGDIRGVIRYYVTDNTTGAKGFFTGQPNYSKPAYLNATGADANVNIKTLKPVQVYSEINGKKAIATVPAGKVLENATVVYDNDAHDAYGFTKVQAANGDFLTANTDYVEILAPEVNTNNNAPQSNFSGFDLQGGQHMADYYNNLSQD